MNIMMLLVAVGVFWVVAALALIAGLCLATHRSVPSCQSDTEGFPQPHQSEPRAHAVAKPTLSPSAAFRRQHALG